MTRLPPNTLRTRVVDALLARTSSPARRLLPLFCIAAALVPPDPLEGLSSPIRTVFTSAVYALEGASTTLTREPLIEAATSPDPVARARAGFALRRLELDATELLDRDEPEALAALRDHRAVGPLARIGGDPEQPPARRVAAADGLGRIDDRDAAPALLALALEPDARVRAAAVRGLARQRRAGWLPDVSPLFRAVNDPDPRVRRAALEAAFTLGEIEFGPAVLGRLTDEDPGVRRDAITVSLALDPSGLAPVLPPLLDDPHPRVRDAASAAAATILR